jgi:YesN/AraC family two-component response regulator
LRLGKEHFDINEFADDSKEYSTQQLEIENLNYDLNNAAESPNTSISESEDERTIVLVVEDNPDVRNFIKDSLVDDYQVEEASNGEQGIKKAQSIIPDLVVSDIMMPKMDGNELTRVLKNDERTSHIPIILLTAKSDQASKLQGLETGADDFLIKPFDTKELQVRIRNLINIRRKLQQKFGSGELVFEKSIEEKKLNVIDEKFLTKVMEVIERHISEEEFSIEQFGKEVGMSRTQLHRKLKALSGKSPSNFLRSVRLGRAKLMIEKNEANISEIAYQVGFSSPAYFSRCFKDEFGYPPSDLAN